MLAYLFAYDCPIADAGRPPGPPARGAFPNHSSEVCVRRESVRQTWERTVMNLEFLGADSRIYGAFERYAAHGLVLGRVAFAQRDQYRILTELEELEGEASGALWYRTPDRAAMPVVGDWVAARLVGSAAAIVEAVLPRSSCFSRRAAGRREDEQPVAANIDLVFLVCGLDGNFNLRRLERYLTLAAESGAQPVVVLNKSDLCGDPAALVEETAKVAGSARILTASMRTQEGIEELKSCLAPG